MHKYNFSIIDVETTGGSPRWSRVIEIGILRVEHGEVTAKYQSLVNPGAPIPEFITELTGITDRKVKNAPTFDEIKDEILDLLTGSIFVAHNSSFDYGFIKSEFRRVGYGFMADTLCTVRLSRALFPEYKRHNLSELIDRFDFKVKNRHRAFDDAKVLWDFLQFLPSRFDKEKINQALDRTIKKIPPAKQRRLENRLGGLKENALVYDYETI
jgi:DNA polymerase-3 subunit epsilon